MSRSIEQTILSLMPTHGPQLPPRLVDSARTLLVQSRQRAATLKADEEIARLYACAHLACERLKIPLNLPPIEPRAPIPPRVYKRLFTHLDNILPGRATKTTTTPTTVRVRDAVLQSSPALGSSIPRQKSPSESIAKAKTPASKNKGLTLVDTPSKSTSGGIVRSVKLRSGLPPWIRSCIGFLVNNHNQKKWGRYVLAGVDYVIAPSGKRTKDAWVLGHMAAVVAGVFHISMDVLGSFGADGDVEQVAGPEGLRKTAKLMQKARSTISVKGLAEDEFWEGWGEVVDMRTLKKAKNLVTSHWIDADWYRALEDRARQLYEPENAEPEGRNESEDAVRIQKPDTMHQERYEFLSKEKRAEIKAWRTSVMQRIEALERERNATGASTES